MLKFAVVGSPILHSLSPQIHNYMYQYNGSDSKYIKIVSNNIYSINNIINHIGLDGINITAPYKTKLAQQYNSILPVINTIDFRNNSTYNTDILALKEIIEKHNVRDVIVIGGGDSSYSAAKAASELGKQVKVLSRNPRNIKSNYKLDKVKYYSYSDNKRVKENVIFISTIPSIHNVNLDLLHIKQSDIVIDALYYNNTLCNYTKYRNAIYCNGIEWLVKQAAFANSVWNPLEIQFDIENKIIEQLSSFIRPRKKKIALIGFMGAGKSTIGKELAKSLGWNYFDIDERIEKQENTTIIEVFRTKGEKYFRNLEQQFLIQSSALEKCIVSCGGGIIEDLNNLKYFKDFDHVFWIYRDINGYKHLIKSDNRPLWDDNIDELFESRKEKYFQFCTSIVDNIQSKEDTVNMLKNEIELYYGK